MTDKQDYLAALRAVILHLHDCDAVYLKTEHVHETLQGQTLWNGDVEVFMLINHPKARMAYAWGHPEGKDTRYVVVLELPPIAGPKSAVQASIRADSQRHQS